MVEGFLAIPPLLVFVFPQFLFFATTIFILYSQTYRTGGYRPAYDYWWTGIINRYDAPMYYFVAEGAALRGVRSSYRNHHEYVSFAAGLCFFSF